MLRSRSTQSGRKQPELVKCWSLEELTVQSLLKDQVLKLSRHNSEMAKGEQQCLW